MPQTLDGRYSRLIGSGLLRPVAAQVPNGRPQEPPVWLRRDVQLGPHTTAEGEPISYENVFGDAMADAAGDAAAVTIGDAAGGAVGGAIAKGLFSAFGKKKKAEPEPAAEPVAGSVRLFRFESETTKIKTKAVASDHFEIPAGFTPVE